MADFLDKYDLAPDPASSQTPPAPAAPKSFLDAYELAPEQAPRQASGLIESMQAGFQSSATGLAWRGKLPDLITDPKHAAWWERAATGITQVASELPLMAVGAAAGAPVGAAAGTAIAPGPGTAVGTVLGTGAGMFALPAAIRETLIQAYKSGEIKTADQFWGILREVAMTTAKEGAIGAATMGAGGIAARTFGKAIAPSIGTSMSVPTAIKGIGAADVAAQIGTMVTIPAAMRGEWPDAQEFMDAAIVIGGIKGAHSVAPKITNTFLKTGKTPAEQVKDVQDGKVPADEFGGNEPAVSDDARFAEKKAAYAFARTELDAADASRKEAGLVPLTAEEKDAQVTADVLKWQARANEAARPLYLSANPKGGWQIMPTPLRAESRAKGWRQIAVIHPEKSAEAPRATAVDPARATAAAESRLTELMVKSESEPLTDAERIERVFLTQNKGKPEALARHFELKATDAHEESAQRVHDDVLEQLRAVDEARRDTGRTPLGDDHAQAVAALVRARVATRAARLGMTPEEVYRERPLQIRDEAQAEAEAAAAPEGATTFTPPEVDLFGAPIEQTNAPRHAVENLATQEVPLENLKLSKEVPQFKGKANEEGVITPLGGQFDRTGVGPIQVWERLDGSLEVISGRHRLDLARRTGETTIPAQIHRESEGFTAGRAAALDAELNIREEQGSVADYVQHFQNSGITKEAADELGLLARTKGRTAWAIARDASPDLAASHRAGVLSDEAALAISAAAPGSARLQALGMAMVQQGKSALIAVNTMKAVELMAADRIASGAQGDIFGFDDSAMIEASTMAKKATSIQRKISEQISAVSGASRRPELARKMGVDVSDPEGIQKKIVELKQEQYLWDNWPIHPELVAKLRGQLGQEPVIKFDEKDGVGAVPDNQNVDYLGFSRRMTPTEFLALARHLADPKQESITRLREHIAEGGTVGVPFLEVRWNDEAKGWDVVQHEGRHRATVIAEMAPNTSMPVHLFPRDGMRARDITDEMRAAPLIAEDTVRYRELMAEARRVLDDPNILHQAETPAEAAKRDHEASDQAERKDDPNTLYQSKPTFYSELERQLEARGSLKASPAQWKSTLQNLKGIKADEIKWSGVEEWLDTQEGQVTRDQVLDYLRGNGVKVIEVVLGNTSVASVEQQATVARANQIGTRLHELGWDVDADPDTGHVFRFVDQRNNGEITPDDIPVARSEEFDLMREAVGMHPGLEIEGSPKFSQYTLPGGENYRELLLTLPTNDATELPVGYRIEHMADGRYTLVGPSNVGSIMPAGIHKDDVKAYAIQQLKNIGMLDQEPTFTSSHFDTPNILAHIRFNDRTDADGKRVLFVEEIQSDWAQKGKREGFQGGPDEYRAEHVGKWAPEGDEKYRVFRNGEDIGFYQAVTETGAIDEARARNYKPSVPAAPFVTKTEAWTALALKRMIRWAAANDYDRIAWTTGEQQVERYTIALRKAVDQIEWTKTDKGVQLVGYKEGGRSAAEVPANIRGAATEALRRNDWLGFDTAGEAMSAIVTHPDWEDRWQVEDPADVRALNLFATKVRSNVVNRTKVVDTTEQENALSDAIGKAMAENILNDPAQTGTIEGENLRIDSTGMAAFYDRILPNVANGLLKKLGGGKVGDLSIAIGGGKSEVPEISKGTSAQLDPYQGAEDFPQGGTPLWGHGEIAVKSNPDASERYAHELNVEMVIERNGIHFMDQEGSEFWASWSDMAYRPPQNMSEAKKLFEILWQPRSALWRVLNSIDPNGDIYEPAGGRTATKQTGFDVTPALKAKALEGLPLFQHRQETNRGEYDIAENLVTTLQGADRSTVVHELGHSWLEEMKFDAARANAPADIKADWDTLRRELAIGDDGEISRASHEQFARSVERYLMEGEAPSPELRSVFARFREWLIAIYESVMNLNVTINPDLKAVLDRMLAVDQDAADAKALDVPTAYVGEARANEAAKIVTPPELRKKVQPGFEAEQASMIPYADELPPGPGEAPDRTHVNYGYMNAPIDVKLATQRMAEIDQQNIQARRGGAEGVKSWEAAREEQKRYVEQLLGGEPGELDKFINSMLGADRDPVRVDVLLGVMKKATTGAAKESARLRDIVLAAGHDATIRQQLEYMGSLERMRMIQAEYLGQRAAVARALNALKDTTEGSGEITRLLEEIGTGDENTLFQAPRTPAEEQAYMKAKLDEIMAQYRGKTPLDIARLHKEIGTLKGSMEFAKAVTEATKWEMLVEGWKSGLLSGPVTHTTNLFGTGAFMAMRAPVDALAAIIGMARGASPGMGESDRASMSEAVARMTGMLGGIQDGAKVAWHTFMADEATPKVEQYRNAIPGAAGHWIRTPLRAMAAEDAMVSTMYTRGELRTLAIRQAFDENMNPGTREFAERVDHLVDNPTPDMQVAAETAATRMTFNAPLGEKGVALQLFVRKWNLEWMIPFIRTPINIAKELGRMSPFAPIVGEWRAAMAKGGVERDRALAEFTLGSGIMAVTMGYAFSGDISGAGSPDPGKNRGKAGVWQPYSVLIGDKWYEYGRLQPTGTLIGMAADLASVWDHLTDEEKDKAPKMLAVAFSNAVTNQTFLQGITNFVNAMSDPTRFAPRFGQQLAASMVPNIIGQPTAMADPYVREVNSILEAVQARIPGMRQDLLPKRDWLGEEVPTKERAGVVSPVRVQEVSDDKVRLEAARLNISMAAAPKKTHIGKGSGKLGNVELTPEERDTFERVGGEMAHRILTNIVAAPNYDAMPDLIKQKLFAKVLHASHQVAAVAALPMDKRVAYLQSIAEKVATALEPAE